MSTPESNGETATLAGRSYTWDRVPAEQQVSGEEVTWRCHGTSDYWRITEGVPVKHDGSALLTPFDGDFTVEMRVEGDLVDLYDQMGMLIVANEERWLKAGVEIDGGFWLSAVHTRGESDWSREAAHGPSVELRAERVQGTIEVSVKNEGTWRVFRTLYLPDPVAVGPYSCAPKGPGFQARATIAVLAP